MPKPPQAHALEAFVAYLRRVGVAPIGHANARKRKLIERGVQYAPEGCRAMYTCAVERRLPPYAGNTFAELTFDKMRV